MPTAVVSSKEHATFNRLPGTDKLLLLQADKTCSKVASKLSRSAASELTPPARL